MKKPKNTKLLRTIFTRIGFYFSLLAILFLISVPLWAKFLNVQERSGEIVTSIHPDSLPYVLGIFIPLATIAVVGLVGSLILKKPHNNIEQKFYFMHTTSKKENNHRLSLLFSTTGIALIVIMITIMAFAYTRGYYACEVKGGWFCEFSGMAYVLVNTATPLTILGVIAICAIIIGGVLRMKRFQ